MLLISRVFASRSYNQNRTGPDLESGPGSLPRVLSPTYDTGATLIADWHLTSPVLSCDTFCELENREFREITREQNGTGPDHFPRIPARPDTPKVKLSCPKSPEKYGGGSRTAGSC